MSEAPPDFEYEWSGTISASGDNVGGIAATARHNMSNITVTGDISGGK